jgi:peptidoglycan-N-acetylglucosamine deacetylase
VKGARLLLIAAAAGSARVVAVARSAVVVALAGSAMVVALAGSAMVVALAGSLVFPGGAVAAGAPLGVRTASLTQDGQQLVWQVKLDHPFSPAAMKRAGRTLCLVLRRASTSAVSGVVCATPPRDGRHPQLIYQRVTARGRGPGRAIGASVGRSSSSELTARFLPGDVGIGYGPVRWQVLSTLGAPACVSPAVCAVWFPSKPALARLHVPQVVGCVPSGPPLAFNGPTNRHEIALTFDDGPWPDTPQVLDILEREHVHATFFQIGEQVSTFGRAVDRRMLADGDMIGDHTWSHANVSGDGPFAAGQISQTVAAIRTVTGGFTPCLFRPPGGAFSSALVSEARSMGFTTILWNVDPRDWSRPGTGAIYGNVVGNARNGAIVIQHDGGGDRSQTLAALPREIATLRSRGYRFVTVTELLGQRLIYK